NAVIVSDNISMIADSNYTLNANNEASMQVGDTSITTKGDSVIIKAGGIEVVIDSNGLVVKGGEVKSE
ncbi:hypothetical protein HRAG_02277, partial [Helicobacter bilis ATCC 43879]